MNNKNTSYTKPKLRKSHQESLTSLMEHNLLDIKPSPQCLHNKIYW